MVRIFNSQVPYTQLFPPSFLPLSTVPPISLRSFLYTQATFSGTLQSLSPRPPSSSAFLIPPLCVCVCVLLVFVQQTQLVSLGKGARLFSVLAGLWAGAMDGELGDLMQVCGYV